MCTALLRYCACKPPWMKGSLERFLVACRVLQFYPAFLCPWYAGVLRPWGSDVISTGVPCVGSVGPSPQNRWGSIDVASSVIRDSSHNFRRRLVPQLGYHIGWDVSHSPFYIPRRRTDMNLRRWVPKDIRSGGGVWRGKLELLVRQAPRGWAWDGLRLGWET